MSYSHDLSHYFCLHWFPSVLLISKKLDRVRKVDFRFGSMNSEADLMSSMNLILNFMSSQNFLVEWTWPIFMKNILTWPSGPCNIHEFVIFGETLVVYVRWLEPAPNRQILSGILIMSHWLTCNTRVKSENRMIFVCTRPVVSYIIQVGSKTPREGFLRITAVITFFMGFNNNAIYIQYVTEVHQILWFMDIW